MSAHQINQHPKLVGCNSKCTARTLRIVQAIAEAVDVVAGFLNSLMIVANNLQRSFQVLDISVQDFLFLMGVLIYLGVEGLLFEIDQILQLVSELIYIGRRFL